jgi:SAM-dependent methyltransferase
MAARETAKRRMKRLYARMAEEPAAVCPVGDHLQQAAALGYSAEEIERLPKGAWIGLGCGNPLLFAGLKAGETVLDLGSGGGRDAFLAAHRVGRKGRVIGVDMTPEMVRKAEANAREGGYGHVTFKVAEMEKLPVESDSVDCVISNCVINHSPDQVDVFSEAFRVLKRGGRMAISDLVLEGELSREVRRSLEGTSACLASSLERKQYLDAIRRVGFRDVTVVGERPFGWEGLDPRVAGKVTSVVVTARK